MKIACSVFHGYKLIDVNNQQHGGAMLQEGSGF